MGETSETECASPEKTNIFINQPIGFILANKENQKQRIWVNVYDLVKSGLIKRKNIYQYIKKEITDNYKAKAYELYFDGKCIVDIVKLPRKRCIFVSVAYLEKLVYG